MLSHLSSTISFAFPAFARPIRQRTCESRRWDSQNALIVLVMVVLVQPLRAAEELTIEDYRNAGDAPALPDNSLQTLPPLLPDDVEGTPEQKHEKFRQHNVAKLQRVGLTWETVKASSNYVLAKPSDYVTVHLIGKIRATGHIFEDTYRRNAPFTFYAGSTEAIVCLDAIASIMREGEIVRVTCPPKYAYGRKGVQGAVPPGAWLVFEVELMKIFCNVGCIGTNPPTTEAPEIVNERRAKFDEILQPPVPYKVDYSANLPAIEMDPFVVDFFVEHLYPDLTGSTSGKFSIRFQPKWAPRGVRRVHELLIDDFFDGVRFHRNMDPYIVGFGINGNPHVMEYWNNHPIKDDPLYKSEDGYKPGFTIEEEISDGTVTNQPKYVTMEKNGPDTRSTQLIINTGYSKVTDALIMDDQGYRPIGVVIEGYEDVVSRIFRCGDNYPHGPGPDIKKILSEGTPYLDRNFPQLTYITQARRRMTDEELAEEEADDPDNFVHVHCHIKRQSSEQYNEPHLIEIEVRPDWAPIGAKRFLELVRESYFDGSALFRAIPNFLVQFGIARNSSQREAWRRKPNIEDDPLRPDIPIEVGTMAFAGSGKNSRNTQVWIALTDANRDLGSRPWETPFGKLVGEKSIAALHRINTNYGDQVDQRRIWKEGYEYLDKEFPGLDEIEDCWVDELGRQAPVVLEDEKLPALETNDLGSSFGPLSIVVLVSIALILLCRQPGKKAKSKMWGVEPVKEV